MSFCDYICVSILLLSFFCHHLAFSVIINIYQLLVRNTSSFVSQKKVLTLQFAYCFSLVKFADRVKIKIIGNELAKTFRISINTFTVFSVICLAVQKTSLPTLSTLPTIKFKNISFIDS